MPDPHYQIKLYGHISGDTDEFCRELADVLGIGEQEASDMLLQVPVIAKTGLKRRESERLTERLLDIRALFLVEPEIGEQATPELPAPPAPQPQSLPEIRPRPRDDSARSTFWLGVMAVAGGFFVIFATVAYLSTYSNLYKKPESNAFSAGMPLLKPGPAADKAAAMVPVLEGRIARLAEQLNDLAARQKVLEEEIQSMHGKAATDPFEMRARQQELQAMRSEIASKNREMFELRQELDAMREQAPGGAAGSSR